MDGSWAAYDHYGYAVAAVLGTVFGVVLLRWVIHRSPYAGVIATCHGVVPPFLNVVGVLFALTLAFLANDTWSAHDRAINTTFREAESLHSIKALTATVPASLKARIAAAVDDYAKDVTETEWPLLAQRHSSATASERLDGMLELLASPEVEKAMGAAVHSLVLHQAVEVRYAREMRLALSRTHVNPFKWLGMAFLGFLTMVTVAVVHLGNPRAELAAVLLFAAAAAPTAAIVLVHGNPFQQPAAVSADPIAAVVR
jgi:Protein of unknown function (DUF4239)